MSQEQKEYIFDEAYLQMNEDLILVENENLPSPPLTSQFHFLANLDLPHNKKEQKSAKNKEFSRQAKEAKMFAYKLKDLEPSQFQFDEEIPGFVSGLKGQ